MTVPSKVSTSGPAEPSSKYDISADSLTTLAQYVSEQDELSFQRPLDWVLSEHRVYVNQDRSGQPVPRSPIADFAAVDETMVCRLNRRVLLENLREYQPKIDAQLWPREARQMCHEEFQRISKSLLVRPLETFSASSVAFRKDLRISILRRIPLGAAYGELTGVPRSWVLKAGPRAPWLLRYLMLEAGGFRPFLEMHVNLHRVEDFNEAGWDRTFRRAARLIQGMPEVRGIQCSAWFNDPALETVSPRLAYLRKRYVENGGVCFRVGGNRDEKNLALVRSGTRRRLHAKGEYDPTVYMCVWARRPLLRWALGTGRSRGAAPRSVSWVM